MGHDEHKYHGLAGRHSEDGTHLAVATAGHLPSPNCDGSTEAILTDAAQKLSESLAGHSIEGLGPVFSSSLSDLI